MALRNILSFFDFRINSAPLRKATKESEKYTRTVRKGARATNTLSNSSMGLGKVLGRLTSDFKVLGTAYLGFQGIKGLVKLSDEYVSMQNRLRVVTKGTDEFTTAQTEMFRVARETRQPVKNVTEMFQRYSIATQSLGTSQADVIKLSTALIKGTLLSGTSAESAKGSIIQLAQGLGTNFEAAGQEIRSIQENAPMLAQIIAKAAGGTSDQLMKLAKEGKITSKLVVNAILDASDDLDAKFALRQVLLSEGGTRLRDVLMKSLGQFNEWSKASSVLAGALVGVADAVERIIDSNWTENFINVGILLMGTGLVLALKAAMVSTVAAVTAFIVSSGGLVAALGVASAALARFLFWWVVLPLAVEDFIGFLRGNRSFLGDWLADVFGKESAQEVLNTTRDTLNSIVDMFKIVWSWVTGEALDSGTQDEMQKRSDRLMKSFDRLGTWLNMKAIEIGKNIRKGLFGDFGSSIENFLAGSDEGDSATNSALAGLVNDTFGTNFDTSRKVRRSKDSQANAAGATSPFARGTEADYSFQPVPTISTSGSRTMTINDNRTTTINATSGAGGAQQIASAAGAEMGRDRRAIVAAVSR